MGRREINVPRDSDGKVKSPIEPIDSCESIRCNHRKIYVKSMYHRMTAVPRQRFVVEARSNLNLKERLSWDCCFYPSLALSLDSVQLS